jgi:glucose-6-phosphate-specific signal transduction histidine kinase
VGFRAEEASNKRGSFGLAGLRERVALLGGSCLVESRPRSSPVHTASRSAKAETLHRKARVSSKKKSASAGAPRGAGLWATSVSGTRVLIELPVPTEAVAATA